MEEEIGSRTGMSLYRFGRCAGGFPLGSVEQWKRVISLKVVYLTVGWQIGVRASF